MARYRSMAPRRPMIELQRVDFRRTAFPRSPGSCWARGRVLAPRTSSRSTTTTCSALNNVVAELQRRRRAHHRRRRGRGGGGAPGGQLRRARDAPPPARRLRAQRTAARGLLRRASRCCDELDERGAARLVQRLDVALAAGRRLAGSIRRALLQLRGGVEDPRPDGRQDGPHRSASTAARTTATEFADLQELTNGRPELRRAVPRARGHRAERGIDYDPLIEPMRIFVGLDESQIVAARVLEHSIRKHASRPVRFIPMLDVPTPVPQDPANRGRTGFSFSPLPHPRAGGLQGPRALPRRRHAGVLRHRRAVGHPVRRHEGRCAPARTSRRRHGRTRAGSSRAGR